eukprot:Gb_32424 [translate_table: standard]
MKSSRPGSHMPQQSRSPTEWVEQHRYRASNNGLFPSLSVTHKEVGGSFYTIRQILQEVIHEHKASGTLGTVYNSDKHTRVHAVKPLSVPAETSLSISNAPGKGVEHAGISEPEVETNQEITLAEECQSANLIDVTVGCDSNSQTVIKQENCIIKGTQEIPLVSDSVEPLQVMTEEMSYEEERDLHKNTVFGKETFSEHAIVSSESTMDSYSSLENQCNHKIFETQEQEIHNIAPLSDVSAGCRLERSSLEKQNVEGNLEEMEVRVSIAQEVMGSCSLSTENLSSLGETQETQKHISAESKPEDPTFGSHSSYSVDHMVDGKASLQNSTEEMSEESAKLAVSLTSLPMTTGEIGAQESADFQDFVLKDQNTFSINVDKEKVLTGLEIEATDTCQTVSGSLQPDSSDNLSAPIYAEVSHDRISNATSAVSDQGQVVNVGHKKENTLNNGKPANSADTSEGINSNASESSKGSETSLKLQKNTIWGNLKAIANGIVSFWKKN